MRIDYKLRNTTIKTANFKATLGFKKWNDRLNRAQFALDNAIMMSMEQYMPMVSGNFIQQTKAVSASLAGSGWVCAGVAPYGRYLYMGKVMIETTGAHAFYIEGVGWRHHKGSHLIPTDKDLNYTKTFHPEAQKNWFEIAKQKHEQDWIEVVERQLKNG